jgi:hypothetical protein
MAELAVIFTSIALSITAAAILVLARKLPDRSQPRIRRSSMPAKEKSLSRRVVP